MRINTHLNQLLHKTKPVKHVDNKLEISINYRVELILTDLTTD